MKYINFVVFALLIFIAFILKDSINISTNLLSLFAPKESVNTLYIANQLGYSKELFIAIKGFDSNAKNKLEDIVKELNTVKEVKNITYTSLPPQSIREYYKKYYPLLATFDDRNISQSILHKKLEKIYSQQLHSFFYQPVNTNDPLGLFHMQQQLDIAHKGKYLVINNYGYLIKATTTVSPSQVKKAEKLYENIQNIIKKYPQSIAFSGFFYTVENSAKIKTDVKYIATLSIIVLLLIYLLMLKDKKLLVNTILAQISSMLFATLICTTTIENFGALSLAFGVSLSAVSIDYLFHYYFHNFYHQKKFFDKNVFFGFVTTMSAFFIFSFIPITLIAQISIFAVYSLSFAYIMFTFAFKFIGIKQFEQVQIKYQDYPKVPAIVITVISIILLIYASMHMKYNENIKTLDYQNIKLQKIQHLFESVNTTKLSPVIVEASSKDALLADLHKIKNATKKSFSLANFVLDQQSCQQKKQYLKAYDFKRLNEAVNKEADNIGFRDGYFKNSYKFAQKLPSCSDVNVNIFQKYNLPIYKEKSKYYTIALVDDVNKVQAYAFVRILSVKEMFAKVADAMLHDIIKYSSLVLFIIFLFLLISVQRKILYALNYILFPVALSFYVITLLYEVNIMHLFSFVILIAIGIDYGIYMSNTKKLANTMLAIKYSLLSTFAAFGVLIFSDISALYSIGIVISIGVGAIYLLTKVMR